MKTFRTEKELFDLAAQYGYWVVRVHLHKSLKVWYEVRDSDDQLHYNVLFIVNDQSSIWPAIRNHAILHCQQLTDRLSQ